MIGFEVSSKDLQVDCSATTFYHTSNIHFERIRLTTPKVHYVKGNTLEYGVLSSKLVRIHDFSEESYSAQKLALNYQSLRLKFHRKI